MAGYSLWLKPYGHMADKLEQRILNLSEIHHTPSFPPHITLLGGLSGKKKRLIQLADTLAASVRPFEVLLTKADHTASRYRSLFVDVAPEENLESVRLKAVKLFEHTPEEEYRPHLSLMYGNLDPAGKEKILNVMGREFHIRLPVHHLQLVKTDGPTAEWEQVHAVELGVNR